ncbi:NB-ARC [Penicillium occitanis (nom. inval.)]|nr:NB-ARC [Penicillium occitanis (nom. inval.)]PCG92848.1 hypothetical protein PENOC_090530 [Penicillium occitanis (nom. inval.)]
MESAVHLRPESRDEFEIAIICALPVERNAIEALLEVDYEADGFSYKKAEGDPNTYTTGRLGNQHVVLAYMPGMGMVPAAAVTSNLRSSFKNIKVGIVVGVCGGATKTTAGEEILLGDVIISTSVIQIDFGRQYPHRFIKKKETEDTLGRAGPELRAFIGKMSGYLMSSRLKAKTNSYSSELCSRKEFLKSAYPGPEKDRLHQADLSHKHWTKGICSICDQCSKSGDEVCEDALTASCTELGCDGNKLVHRGRIQQAMEMGVPEDWTSITEIKEARKACIHFGRMACSSQVVKTGQERDRIASEEGVIGFEMESAGTWDYIPTIVIKSVCDYADSHKDKRWQAHASITAAACTKAVLEEWRSVDRPVQNLVNQEASDPTSAPNPVHWTVTRPANTLFVGRDDILCELENLVCSAIKRPSYHDQCWIVISGIGGQGKSEICLQLANRVRQSFWGIFWIDVSTETLAQSGFLDIASQLRMHARTWENARQSLANQKEPWLLVLDNADNPDVDYQQYFPSNTSGVVILTSRNSDCQQYATAKWIKLEGLPDVKACELLLQAARVPRESHITLEHDASIVVNLLRSHPLAIIQAGSYVSRGHCALKDYPKIFNKQRKRLLAFRPSQAQSRYRDVYTTFEASIEMLQSSDTESAKDALDLLPILALCGPNRLPISLLFESVWNAVQKFKTDSEDNDFVD